MFQDYQLFNHRVVTLVADKLEPVARRGGSETNCILRQLERKLVQIILQP